jgi:hypothetical protein
MRCRTFCCGQRSPPASHMPGEGLAQPAPSPAHAAPPRSRNHLRHGLAKAASRHQSPACSSAPWRRSSSSRDYTHPQLLETDGVVPNLRHVTHAIAVKLHGINIVGCYGVSRRPTRSSRPGLRAMKHGKRSHAVSRFALRLAQSTSVHSGHLGSE